MDYYQYGYDADSNVSYRENLVDAVFSELYTYNDLSELTNFERGTLTSPLDAISGTPTATQSWDLDALGNFTSVTTNGTTVDNTANQQNEYTALGSATPTYDANGNMTTDETGQQYVYDAWNRLVAVENSSSDVEAGYSYDGLGRRVTETHGDTTTTLYFSSAGQVLEEQVGGVTQARNVWSPVYVNALVLRDQSSEGDGTLDQRLYVMQDANWNVTGLVDTSGNVVERYVYSPYGVATVLAPDWSTRGSSDYGWLYLFQGGRYDAATGDYKFDARDYRPTTGQWLERDPLGLAAGDQNNLRMEGNNTENEIDPTGLEKMSRSYDPLRLSYLALIHQEADNHYFNVLGIHQANFFNDDLEALLLIEQARYDQAINEIKQAYQYAQQHGFINVPNPPPSAPSLISFSTALPQGLVFGFQFSLASTSRSMAPSIPPEVLGSLLTQSPSAMSDHYFQDLITTLERNGPLWRPTTNITIGLFDGLTITSASGSSFNARTDLSFQGVNYLGKVSNPSPNPALIPLPGLNIPGIIQTDANVGLNSIGIKCKINFGK